MPIEWLTQWINRQQQTRLVAVGSYEEYRRTQNEGNTQKLNTVFAKPENIAHLARYISNRIGSSPRILCHGTRNGAEMRYFLDALPRAEVLGTEIADSARDFPNTIQWDFHDLKPEWIGAWDVVYSNSWDHAFDPERAFHNWMQCLTPRGIMLLDHTKRHTPKHANKLDPFGIKLTALVKMLDRIGAPDFRVIDVICDLPRQRLKDRTVVVARL